ncbi:MAG TPA: oligoendopeptidase F [Syntrophomonadaceae bacterium]|nr:oligoendopeptidase F [Syntrophomonadaceae bacterium]HPU48530.1 oligoendopeptidase F [Syntrophomonadaceae bacterium]
MTVKARKREEIAEEYRWQLEDIYRNQDDWEQDFQRVKELIEQIGPYQGRVGESASTLKQVLQILNEMQRKTDNLYVYSRMRRDEDNSKAEYQTLFDRAESLSVQCSSAVAFVVPELLSLSREQIKEYEKAEPELAVYAHYFDELFRQKEHILGEKEERLLAMSADLSSASNNIFTMLNNADIKFPTIRDENGQEVELTKGRYGRFMESRDRRVRKEAYEGLYSSYKGLINTLAATLSSSIKRDIFYARARNYPSALHAALDQDNVPVEVYNQLIASVNNHLDSMYRYMKIRKKLLQVDPMYMYDIYVPLVADFDMKVTYEEAKEITLQGLKPLGEEYLSVLRQGYQGRWIDVYENQGKTSGAYSWGTYDTHPYVLMNYDDKLDDLFTLAHEMGHSLHSYYSNLAQPYIYSQYSIFVAEVASTVNESLLIDYLLKNTDNPQEKMYLLNHYLEQFRGTVYRQTMFAEFEKITHERVEAGDALTPENLGELYLELNKKYYGPEVEMDDNICAEWARIPHFYSAFYVYKYATGFSAATAIKQSILEEGQPAVDRYLDFLKSGSSDYPINLLKKAGVDLTTPEPVEKALTYFSKLLDEFEKLAFSAV